VAYAADWALFADWCTATGHDPLPTDAAALEAFERGCPAAPATQRRRRNAIDYHHHMAGYPPLTEPRGPSTPMRPRTPIDPDQVAWALRLLPSHGWTMGLFGRRDRALIVLAAHTAVPYRQLARISLGQIHVTGGTATVADQHGRVIELQATKDPVLCGPCALTRWQGIIDVDVRPDLRGNIPKLLAHAPAVTSGSRHACHHPEPIHPDSMSTPLFPPINQWGHFPLPIRQMSRRAAAHLARQPNTGLTGHKTLLVQKFLDATTTPTDQNQPTPGRRPVWDFETANLRKTDAVRQLAPLADMFDDLDARIAELLVRTKDLENWC